MYEKLILARDLLAEVLADDNRKQLVRVGRILEELCDSWTEWGPDDVVSLPDDHYSVQQFIDDLPF